MDWRYDIAGFITRTAKTPTLIIQIDDLDAGIHADVIDVRKHEDTNTTPDGSMN